MSEPCTLGNAFQDGMCAIPCANYEEVEHPCCKVCPERRLCEDPCEYSGDAEEEEDE